MEATVATLLERKGRDVITVPADTSLLACADVLTRRRVGAVPVLGPAGRILGVISERDIVRAFAEFNADAVAIPVERIMSREVSTCALTDTVSHLAAVMTKSRIRHLPVVENGVLIGIVSIGDVVKHRLEEAEGEVDALRTFITS